jgi:hypothetical protein
MWCKNCTGYLKERHLSFLKKNTWKNDSSGLKKVFKKENIYLWDGHLS